MSSATPNHSSQDESLHPIAAGLARWVDVPDEDARKIVLDNLRKYFENLVLLETTSHDEALQFLYSQNDNQTYDILSMRNGDHYDMFVTPSNGKFYEALKFSAANFLKSSGLYEGEQLHFQLSELGKNVKLLKKVLRTEYTFTSRVAKGKTTDSLEYPSVETMKVFYECGRKVKYDSPDEALSSLDERCHFYSCKHCGRYHQGRPRQEETLKTPDDTEMLKRYKRAWNTYHRKDSAAAIKFAKRVGNIEENHV